MFRKELQKIINKLLNNNNNDNNNNNIKKLANDLVRKLSIQMWPFFVRCMQFFFSPVYI